MASSKSLEDRILAERNDEAEVGKLGGISDLKYSEVHAYPHRAMTAASISLTAPSLVAQGNAMVVGSAAIQ